MPAAEPLLPVEPADRDGPAGHDGHDGLDEPLQRRAHGGRRALAQATLVGAFLVCGALVVFPLVHELVEPTGRAGTIAGFAIGELALLALGVWWVHRAPEPYRSPAERLRVLDVIWLVLVCLVWSGLIASTPDASYTVLALYFLVLWLLPPGLGLLGTAALGILTATGLVVHHGWSSGSVVGPLAGAGLAMAVMVGYRALVADVRERERLVAALRRTHERLVASERDAARLAERARLGRELHDTVAQSLSSIQLLLHAAEREARDGDDPTARIDQARIAAADALAQTRAVIRDLTPAPLAGAPLVSALRGVARQASTPGSLDVGVTIEGEPVTLPMTVEATVLRIAQEALANIARHADARNAWIALRFEPDAVTLDVGDDGVGFDAEATVADAADASAAHFGLAGMRARAAELGGHAVVVSQPGEGALVSVRLPRAGASGGTHEDAAEHEPGGEERIADDGEGRTP